MGNIEFVSHEGMMLGINFIRKHAVSWVPKWIIEMHGAFLFYGWTILSMLLIISGKYMRNTTRYWRQIHTVIGIVIALITVGWDIASYVLAKAMLITPLLALIHNLFGVLIGVICVILCINGIYLLQIRSRPKNNDNVSTFHKLLHRYLAYTAIILSMITNHIGVWMMYNKYTYWYYLFNAGYLVVILIFCLLAAKLFYSKSSHPLDIAMLDQDGFKYVAMLNQKGGKYAFFENNVVDLKPFESLHPGSKNFINEFVGMELSRFIYGGFECEKFNPHYHTQDAFNIIQSLTVGTIPNHTARLMFIPISKGVCNPDQLIFKVAESEQVTSSFTCFKFMCDSVQIRSMAVGVKHIGRYFSLFSTKLQMGRNYCNSFVMNPKIYNLHLEAAKDYLNGKEIKPSLPEISLNYKKHLELYIKKKTGLSKFVYDMSKNVNSPDNSFQVRGPLGSGLLLDDKEKQVIVALTCGTGSILLVDIAAYIVRYYINRENKGNIFEKEEFLYNVSNLQVVLFSSYHSESEVIGKQIFEYANDICKSLGVNTFKYNLRISERKDPYWSPEYFEKVIGNEPKTSYRALLSTPPSMEPKLKKDLQQIGFENQNIIVM